MTITDAYPPVGLGPDLAVDAVYVLSVKSYADRIAHVTQELGRHGIRFELILDFDADEIDLAKVGHYFASSATPMFRHVSLTLKHLETWRRAVACGHRCILVFEDDVILHPQFGTRMAEVLRAADTLAPGWLVFLGGADTRVPDAFFLHAGPLVPLANATAEGYLTDLEACRRRLAWLDANKIADSADHLIARIDREKGIAQYWPLEPLVEQGSVTGLYRSALDSSRMKHGHLYNVLRYRWTKWWRRTFRKRYVRGMRALRPGRGAAR
jgi:glycosyl transferase family 25